jgi:hypothetical protein
MQLHIKLHEHDTTFEEVLNVGRRVVENRAFLKRLNVVFALDPREETK